MSRMYEDFSNQAIIVNESECDNAQHGGDLAMDIENGLNSIDYENVPVEKVPSFKHGIPSGSYSAQIMRASRRVHQDGYDVVQVSLSLSTRPYSGYPLVKYYNLKSKAAVDFFRREMNELGITVTTRADLDSLCNSLLGKDVITQLADHPSGNQVILLKRLKVSSNADDLWS